VAADPDRDSVWLVNLPAREVRARVRLPSGAEPGRVIEDQDGNIHVALRRAGQVAKINPWTGAILATRDVCAAPRGLAYDGTNDHLYVACAGGELVTLLARSETIHSSWYIDTDLRDIAIVGSQLLISRFRSAELLAVDAQGSLLGRSAPRKVTSVFNCDDDGNPITASPSTAWRMARLPDGRVAMLHQRGQDNRVSTKRGGYGRGVCDGTGIVAVGLTLFDGTISGPGPGPGPGPGVTVTSTALAVDLAVRRDGAQLALISPRPTAVVSGPLVELFQADGLSGTDGWTSGQCLPLERWKAQPRSPALLYGLPGTTVISLDGAEDKSDVGHEIFHTPTVGSITCASCHAEAGEDGRVWTFDDTGPRRTPSLRGGLLATAPFHWDGDLSSMGDLMNEVFTGRMEGLQLNDSQVAAVASWLDSQPEPPRPTPPDRAAVARGKALFLDSQVGCASCHSGPHFTNNTTVNVGTGKAFQVPSLLGLAARAPYLHSGCAASLIGRFDPACGGGDQHGHTSQLTTAQLGDLVAYLETL
jgi:mono/diheme cytochrome c family protein